VVPDLVLSPNCDLHIAMADAPQLTLKVFPARHGTAGMQVPKDAVSPPPGR
jgi:hypothetical protein